VDLDACHTKIGFDIALQQAQLHLPVSQCHMGAKELQCLEANTHNMTRNLPWQSSF
jgi:hypothetical protein